MPSPRASRQREHPDVHHDGEQRRVASSALVHQQQTAATVQRSEAVQRTSRTRTPPRPSTAPARRTTSAHVLIGVVQGNASHERPCTTKTIENSIRYLPINSWSIRHRARRGTALQQCQRGVLRAIGLEERLLRVRSMNAGIQRPSVLVPETDGTLSLHTAASASAIFLFSAAARLRVEKRQKFELVRIRYRTAPCARSSPRTPASRIWRSTSSVTGERNSAGDALHAPLHGIAE